MSRVPNSVVCGMLALSMACGTQEPAPKPTGTVVGTPAPARQPLPENAYQVEWGETTVPASLTAGQSVPIRVDLTNRSPVVWPSGLGTSGSLYTVRLTHRWLKRVRNEEPEEVVGYLGVRAEVPPLGPGQSASVEGVLTAPAKRGRYLVEFELLHEGVAMFSSKGAPTKRVEVEVKAAP